MATQTITDDKNNPNAIAVDESVSIFKYVLIAAVALIVAVVGYNFYQSKQESSFTELGNKVYQFQEGYFTPAIEKKKDANFEGLVAEFDKLFKHEAASSGALTVESIKLADFLTDHNRNEEAKNILKKALSFASGDIAKHFIVSRLGVLEQNSGNIDQAIKLYENLLKQKLTIMEDKVYLDLGALYLEKGSKEKATTSLKYVLEKSKDETLLKLARIYLAQ
jgi:predicted negative regulator of RcsB-dependent stress response